MLCLLINYCRNFPSDPLVLCVWGTRQGNWIYDDAIFLCFISLQLWEWPAPSMSVGRWFRWARWSWGYMGSFQNSWNRWPSYLCSTGQGSYILPSVHQLCSIMVWLEFQLLLHVWIRWVDSSFFFFPQNVLRSHFCSALKVIGWRALQEQK